MDGLQHGIAGVFGREGRFGTEMSWVMGYGIWIGIGKGLTKWRTMSWFFLAWIITAKVTVDGLSMMLLSKVAITTSC